MNTLNSIYKRSFWIATSFLIAGFLLMAADNISLSLANDFLALTLAPISLLIGYSFIVIGIMKRAV